MEFIPGDQYRLDIVGADSKLIIDSWSGHVTADVVSENGNLLVDTVNSKLYGSLIGNLEDIDGNIIIDVNEGVINADITGDIYGKNNDLLFDADSGSFYGVVVGDIVDPNGECIIDSQTRSIKADHFEGNFYGDFHGSLITDSIMYGSFSGDFTGDVYGELFGNVTGDVTGNVSGNLTGNVYGDVTGSLKGTILSKDNTLLLAEPDESWNQYNFLGGISHPNTSTIPFVNVPIVQLSDSRENSSVVANLNHYDGSSVIKLNLDNSYNATITGDLIGKIFDKDTKNPVIDTSLDGTRVLGVNNRLQIGNDEEHLVAVKGDDIRFIINGISNNNASIKYVGYKGNHFVSDEFQNFNVGDVILSHMTIATHNHLFKDAGMFGFIADDGLDGKYFPSKFFISASDGKKMPSTMNSTKLEFDGQGLLSVKMLQTRGINLAHRDSLRAKPGTIIFNESTKKFQGFTGDEWVDLH